MSRLADYTIGLVIVLTHLVLIALSEQRQVRSRLSA
jgi:hypothetical protein